MARPPSERRQNRDRSLDTKPPNQGYERDRLAGCAKKCPRKRAKRDAAGQFRCKQENARGVRNQRGYSRTEQNSPQEIPTAGRHRRGPASRDLSVKAYGVSFSSSEPHDNNGECPAENPKSPLWERQHRASRRKYETCDGATGCGSSYVKRRERDPVTRSPTEKPQPCGHVNRSRRVSSQQTKATASRRYVASNT